MGRPHRRHGAKRNRIRHTAVHLNTMALAINRVRKLSGADVANQVQLMRTALHLLKLGEHCAHQWRSLADSANVAETFAAMGIGAGADAHRVIDQAQRALASIQTRHRERCTWALYAHEIEALTWLIALHAQQLAACDYGEFERALHTTHNRVAQARAGNAPAGAIVITGDIT